MNYESLQVLIEIQEKHREKLEDIVFRKELVTRRNNFTVLINEVLIDGIENKTELANLNLQKIEKDKILELALKINHVTVIDDFIKLIKDDEVAIDRFQENFDDAPNNREGLYELANQLQHWLIWGVNRYLDYQRTILEGSYNGFKHNVTEIHLLQWQPYHDIYRKITDLSIYIDVAAMLFFNRKQRFTGNKINNYFIKGHFKGKKVLLKLL